MPARVNIFWFRRDLRLHDNAGLYHALKQGLPVLPIFIYDSDILDKLEDKTDRRVSFIYNALVNLQEQLTTLGSTLDTRYGKPLDVFKEILKDYTVEYVFTNHDHEPYAIERDSKVAGFLREQGVKFHHYKDQVILEKNEVLKDDGKPYTVFTPYSKKWKAVVNDSYLRSYPNEKYHGAYYKQAPIPLIKPGQIGFEGSQEPFPSSEWSPDLVRHYQERRDFPSQNGTSRLGVHLRFGTISIRQLAREAGKLSETFLNELIWREFYQMILAHFPKVVQHSFKPEYDRIRWRNNEEEFEKWCRGQTGYPIVDAGMRELNETSFMHNRVRMIVASFLTKHLLIDWRWGEAYFASKLLDYDLASNNGGWQWAAGSGCDAAPYFRIFNPYIQAKKFDAGNKYISKWVPEWQETSYPLPVVEHVFARKRCLEVYSAALKEKV